ncbi:unnamed protein product [Peronospora farinosa]|uniref:Transmembrane protein 267 n=1 Tax=Peronospora farinosa TaxID=134698 RepID=A0AAV0TQY7_9STRA|nr:unnamed protein product [Peronospora farinosa]CAI5723584.1 unnamed protein product [Peronospora farinosa]
MLYDKRKRRRRHIRLIRLQGLFMVLLLLICIPSDFFLFQRVYLPDYKLLRHFVDSAAHGNVAFCCWAIFLLQAEKNAKARDTSFSVLEMLKKCFFNGITASVLDADHFIAAGTLNLTGATHLTHRPFGHAVTFIIVVAFLVSWCSKKCPTKTRSYRVCFIVVAWFSHQLRDGMRRGLWFWPIGSTPPITYFLYLLMEEGLPFVMEKWWRQVPARTKMEKLELALDKEANEKMIYESNEEEELRLIV